MAAPRSEPATFRHVARYAWLVEIIWIRIVLALSAGIWSGSSLHARSRHSVPFLSTRLLRSKLFKEACMLAVLPLRYYSLCYSLSRLPFFFFFFFFPFAPIQRIPNRRLHTSYGIRIRHTRRTFSCSWIYYKRHTCKVYWSTPRPRSTQQIPPNATLHVSLLPFLMSTPFIWIAIERHIYIYIYLYRCVQVREQQSLIRRSMLGPACNMKRNKGFTPNSSTRHFRSLSCAICSRNALNPLTSTQRTGLRLSLRRVKDCWRTAAWYQGARRLIGGNWDLVDISSFQPDFCPICFSFPSA